MRTGRARARGPLRPRPLALLALRPGRLARRRPLAGARSCTPCTPWRGSRTSTSPTATPPSRPAARSARSRSSRRPTASSPTPTGEAARARSTCMTPSPTRWSSCLPGSTCRCSPRATRARRGPRSGLPPDAKVLLFVGRIQPLKAPEVLVKAAAELLAPAPALGGRARRRGPRAARAAPAWPTRRRCRSSPSSSASATQVRFVPPVPAARAGRSGTAPPTSCACRRTASRSAWSPSRRRPAAPRSSPPTSAACPPPSATPGCSSTGHDPRTSGPTPSSRCCSTRRARAKLGAPGRRARRAVRLGPHHRPPARGLRRRRAASATPSPGRAPSPTAAARRRPRGGGPVTDADRHRARRSTVAGYLAGRRRSSWERGARDGEFVVTLPGEKKLKTVGLASWRRRRRVGVGLRHPQPGREPRGRSTAPAAQEPAAARPRLRHRHGRRRLRHAGECPRPASTPHTSTSSSASCWTPPTAPSTSCSPSASSARCEGVGLAGLARGVDPQPRGLPPPAGGLTGGGAWPRR